MAQPIQGALIRAGVYVAIAIPGYVLLSAAVFQLTGVALIAGVLGTFAAAAIANAIVLRIFERGQLADIGLGWTAASRRNLLAGVIGGAGGALLVMLLPVVVRVADFVGEPGVHADWSTLLFISVVLLFGAFGEEMLFRGYAFQVLVGSLGPFATILPVSVIFALAHGNNPSFTLISGMNTFLWGVLLGYSFLRSGDLWLPIGLHFGWNWMFPLLGAPLSGFKMGVTGFTMHWRIGDLWSGGAYGVEGGLLTTAVVVLLYFYLDKASIETQRPYLLFKERERS